MRRIVPLSVCATSKFAEIRRCELLPNADSAGGGAADRMRSIRCIHAGNECFLCAGDFLFPHLPQGESDAASRLLD